MSIILNRPAITDALAHLGHAAREESANRKHDSGNNGGVHAAICCAVASLVAGAGPDIANQAELIHAAEAAGFACEFYANSVRVHWND